ncbi:MAG: hypothetical protein AAGU06_03720 [Candidatus Shapirobacteria bacterium]
MSLIFGINLSDKIYLISDTRASQLDSSGNILYVKDNVMKIKQLTNDLAVVCGGDVQLIKYIISNIKRSEILKSSPSEFKANIKSWIGEKVSEYLDKGFPYRRACFIFAYLDRTKNKVIDGPKYVKMAGEFQENSKSQMSMKDVVFQGIKNIKNQHNPKPELPVFNTILFSVVTDAKNMYLEMKEAEWGEYIVFGPNNFDKDKAPKTLFGQLEFEMPQNWSDASTRDVSMLTAFVKDMEESQKLLTVGGSVTSMIIGQETNGVALFTCKIHRMALNGKNAGIPETISETLVLSKRLCTRNKNGVCERLIDIDKYPEKNSRFFV